jgi:Cys-rich protein (TIGR01571 family)
MMNQRIQPYDESVTPYVLLGDGNNNTSASTTSSVTSFLTSMITPSIPTTSDATHNTPLLLNQPLLTDEQPPQQQQQQPHDTESTTDSAYYTKSQRKRRATVMNATLVSADSIPRNRQNWLGGGLFDCFSDMKTCLHGFCCAPCCIPVYQANFNSSDPFMNCCTLDLCGFRYEVREHYHVEGNLFYDCIANLFCWPCSNAQVMREITIRGAVRSAHGNSYESYVRSWYKDSFAKAKTMV